MFPEVAWVVAIHRQNVRREFVSHKAYSLVNTTVVVNAEIVSKPNRDCLHSSCSDNSVGRLCEICSWNLAQSYFEEDGCVKFLCVNLFVYLRVCMCVLFLYYFCLASRCMYFLNLNVCMY